MVCLCRFVIVILCIDSHHRNPEAVKDFAAFLSVYRLSWNIVSMNNACMSKKQINTIGYVPLGINVIENIVLYNMKKELNHGSPLCVQSYIMEPED